MRAHGHCNALALPLLIMLRAHWLVAVGSVEPCSVQPTEALGDTSLFILLLSPPFLFFVFLL